MQVSRSRGTLVKPVATDCAYYPSTGLYTQCSPIGSSASVYNIGERKTFVGDVKSAFRPGILKRTSVWIDTKTGTCSDMEIVSTLPWPYNDPNKRFSSKGQLAAAYFAPSTAVPIWPTSIAERVDQQALSKVSKPGAELGVMLGELTETVNMLRHPLSGLRKSLKKWRSLSTGWGKQRAIKALSGTYLEWIFGWRPVMQDVDTIIQHAVSRGARTLWNLRSRHANFDYENVLVTKNRRGSNCNWYEQDVTRTITSVHSAQYFQFAQCLEERRTMHYWGLSDSDLLNVIWALTPYSFCVDWFVGVGDWLRAIQPPSNVKKLGGCVSVKTTQVTQRTVLPPYTSGTSQIPCTRKGDSVFTWNRQTLDRRLTDAEVGMYPAFKPAWLNLYRAAAGTALITQHCVELLKPFNRR